MKKFFALMFVALLMLSSTSSAETIQATGVGYGPKGANPKSSFYKTYARQAARLDALRRLAEHIESIQVDVYTVVEEYKPKEQRIKTHVSSKVLKKAWQIGETEFDKDNIFCQVTMETNI